MCCNLPFHLLTEVTVQLSSRISGNWQGSFNVVDDYSQHMKPFGESKNVKNHKICLIILIGIVFCYSKNISTDQMF